MPCDAKLALAVLVLEACVGYPRALFAVIGHPVTWIGRLLALLEHAWNQPQFPDGTRRALGIVAVIVVVGLAGGMGLAIVQAAARLEYGGVLVALIATSGLAQRSLYDHVRAVEAALISGGLNGGLGGDLDGARAAVGRIVGRDTTTLDASEVSAAAIESLAESFNDAVVAPAFWLLVGGLPGLLAYKALNTADSMIGHIEPRWRAFGWAAARLDDVANFVPARLAGVLLALAGARGFRVMWRDAPKHASPNAGWPEAAAAGALDLRLGGPACYDGVIHTRPHFGDGAIPQATDLGRALGLYRRGCIGLWLLLASIAILQVSL
jgi:adenosylcobinamide-phosphate synthase